MAYELDLTGYNEDDFNECQVASGRHLATITDVTNNQKTGAIQVHWRFDSPPWTGHSLVDSFNRPDLAKSNDDVPGLIKRMGLFLYRVGAITKDQIGKRISFDRANLVGRRCVLEIKRERNAKKPEDTRLWSNVAYGGYWQLDRPEIPVADRIRLGLPLLPGQVPPPPDGEPPPGAAVPKTPGGNGPPAASTAKAFDPSEV